MKRSPLIALLALTVPLILPLAGCGTDSQKNRVEVSASGEKCAVSSAKADSGRTTFTVTNDGDWVTKFSVLASDGLRVIGERENIAPGDTMELTVELEPGDYLTACKPGMRGPNMGQSTFTVTGEPITYSESDRQRLDAARDNYVNFVKNESAELLPFAGDFVEAYASGNDEHAKALYPRVRTHYQRIQPIAEVFGILNARIDAPEVDYKTKADELEESDPTFTEWLGFHRIEKDLWPPEADAKNSDDSAADTNWEPSDPDKRREIADALIADIEQINEAVNDQKFIENNDITIDSISNGAMGLLDEITTKKVTGEQTWWSHTDLYDIAASIQGSRIAFDMVADIAADRGEKGETLVNDITKRYDEIEKLLAKYGDFDSGFPDYDTVSTSDQKELTRALEDLHEPLSQLNGKVLGLKVENRGDDDQ